MVKKVAIIGFSFRLPQQTNKNNYWNKLISELDLVTEVDSSRWSFDSYLHPSKQNPGTSYTMAAGSLGDISLFDAQFFGISPREAELMDPQQRVLLHLAWEAIEHAGIAPSSLRGEAVGVYIGLSSSDYAYRMADDIQAVDSSTATGNTASIAANRLSYALDLRGPSMSLDTACSSSLVAFHQACLSIRSGETSMALAGGISLHLHPYGFVGFSKASMLSPTGRCQVFDASGDGYVRSEGGGLFLLKDYDQALEDGDPILAVVLNSGVNTDGHKQGITVPNHLTQAQLIQRTMQTIGLHANDLAYVEAHGTGTAIGDPIETQALGVALGQERNQPLPIGSVKSNMGHLETASGAAGLIKLLYAFKHRQVPATIGIKELNPNIDFDDLNLQVNQEPLALPTDEPIRMSINSFGFGGSNAHIILESAPQTPTQSVSHTGALPLLLSAKSPESLRSYANELSSYLQENQNAALYDVAYQLYKRRELHNQRTLLLVQTPSEAIEQLSALAQNNAPLAPVVNQPLPNGDKPVFVFSGNGSQWEGMGHALLEHPVFLEAIQRIDQLFSLYSSLSLEAQLRDTESNGRYAHTDVAQPVLFALQVGLVKLFEHYGIRPAAVVGHSVGEIAAAWASGALSLEQAVQVIFERSRLQETTKGQGQMTAVNVSADQMLALIAEHQLQNHISLAGANSSTGCTIAGPATQLDRIEHHLKAQSIRFKRLDLDYAFHSPAMDPIQDELLLSLASLQPQACRIPMYSVVKGAIVEGQTLDANYWWDNIREPVLFEPAVHALVKDQFDLYVEIGPHPVLRSYVQQACRDADVTAQVLMLCQRHNENLDKVLQRIFEVNLLAPTPSLDRDFPYVGHFIDLPHYAWELESYWHPVTAESYNLIQRHKLHPLLGYPQPQQSHAWENQLDTLLYPYLGEHVVGDAVLLPGSAFLEIALAAAKEHYQTEHIALENLTISSPLVLQEQPAKKVRVHVDESDGRLLLRSKTLAQEENWTEHAQARLVQAANQHWQQENVSVPTRTADFSGAEHHALTQQVGLNYGPHFSAIRQGWRIDQQTIVSELQSDDYVAQDLDQYILHPGLVDSCFQSIVHLLVDHPLFGKGVAFVPVQLEHAYVRTDLGPVRYARTQFLRLNPHSLCANFDLYNADGVHMAHLSEVRFRTARLQSAEPIELSYLDYQLTPRPLTHHHAHFELGALQQQIQHSLETIANSEAYARVATEIDPLLNSLADLYTKDTVWNYHQQQPISRAHLAQLKHEHPERYALLDLLLLRLEQTEEITWQDNQLHMGAPELNPNEVWFELSRDYSDAFALFLVVARIGMHLHEALTGDIELQKLRGPTVSQSRLLGASLGAHQQLAFQHQLAQHLQQQSQQLPAGQRLRIVEIAQNEPWFAEQALHILDANQCDYHFWATNEDALEKARDLQHEYPMLHCDLRQADSLPSADFDVVLISGDFDNTLQADLALLMAEHALVQNGTAFLFSMHASYWHSFIHLDLPQYGLLPQAYWQQRLEHSCLSIQSTIELDQNAPSAYGILATKTTATSTAQPTETTAAQPQQWYIFADTPTGTELANTLSERLGAEHVTCHPHWDLDHLGPEHAIIYLGGLQNEAIPALDVQQQRCADLTHLIQQYPYQNQTLWIVCANATPYTIAPLSAQPSRLTQLNDASTWGFARTLMNESDRLRVKAVDLTWLDSSHTIQQAAQWLQQEFDANSTEQEVVYNAQGQRFAPRLQVVEAPDLNTDTSHQSVRLEFTYPGQLRNLRWQQVQLPALKEQDIKVRIHATGLNFRDVMYTLGMLSDEAVEHGFAGASLGLEFAGVVEAVGTGVTDYQPGDRVVGFGSHSFGTHSISSSSAMAPLPDFIQYEAAATIPSTFFTVYYALKHLAHLEAGERVLIHGAAGGVGIAAIQLATHLGAEIYATASSPEKRDFLRLMGVKHIYDSRSLSFADDILHDTQGEGIDVVLNSLAGEAVNRNLQVLRPFGRFLELGKRDFYQNSRIGLRPFRNNISYFGIDADQLMQAKPALTQRLFKEVMSLMNDGLLAPLPYQAFDANHIVEAFRYMQQARQIGKIVVTYEQPLRHVHIPALPSQLVLQANATYVVTGGLGGFGLRTAQWLVEKGAQHLLLLSRRGASSEEATQALADFKAQGINAHAIACDVTQATEVATAFDYAAQHLPAIKGIIHAATVIDDALIMNLTDEQIRRVLEPKILGAWHLHERSLQLAEPLDLFVVYSSATTLFGNLGQSNYVAANHWLEALMGLRLQQGLAATNVRWGAIDDVGFLARHGQIKEALKDRMGGAALPAALALHALEAMLVHKRSHLGVMELDWNALDRFLPTASSPKFDAMAHLASDTDHDGHHENWAELLATLSPEALQEHVIHLIKEEISEILRLPVPRIDTQQSIYDMGLDSLLGVELVLALENRFGVRIPVMSLNENPTIERLSLKLIDLLQGSHTESDLSSNIQRIAAQHNIDASAAAIAQTVEQLESDLQQPTSRLLH